MCHQRSVCEGILACLLIQFPLVLMTGSLSDVSLSTNNGCARRQGLQSNPGAVCKDDSFSFGTQDLHASICRYFLPEKRSDAMEAAPKNDPWDNSGEILQTLNSD